jgi:hypothetical protein
MAACTQRAGTITPVKSSVVRGSFVGEAVGGKGVMVGVGIGVLCCGSVGVGDKGWVERDTSVAGLRGGVTG